jgi:hypothetical protein
MLEGVALATLAALGWFWYDSMAARERAVKAGRDACESQGLQFLDETVLCTRTRPARDEEGRVKLRRVYAFEFSDDGARRRSGVVVMRGTAVESLELDPYLLR